MQVKNIMIYVQCHTYDFWRFQSRWGLMEILMELDMAMPFNTPHAAHLQMIKTWDWFVVWMAQILFLLGHFETNSMNTDSPT